MGESVDFSRVFAHAPEAALLLDGQGVVLAASDRYVRAVALERERIVGMSLFALPPYLSAPMAYERLKTALSVANQSHVQCPHELPDAQRTASGIAWLSANNVPIEDAQGAILCIRHELQSAPLAGAEPSHTELSKLFDHSYDAIALIDARGKFKFVTPSIRQVTGFTEDEFINAPPLALVHPDDVSGFGAAIKKLQGEPGGLMRVSFRSRHRDGSWRVQECTSVNRLHDPDVAAIVSTFRDVTDQMELHAQLRRSNEQLRVALNAARAISWTWDPNKNVAAYSEDFGSFFGMPPDVELGVEAPANVVHAEDRARVQAHTQRSLATGEAYSFEFRGAERGAATRWYRTHGQVLRDVAGAPNQMVGVTWDITHAKHAEQERELLDRRVQEGQKLESLGVLAGGIAHDFNNILMAILGNASLIQSSVDADSAALPFVAQIEQGGLRAAELCRQMLAYAGKGRFVLSVSDLNKLVEETTHLLQVSISKKAVLRFHLHRDLPPVVADATQIRQVLMNFVINASDAIGDRSGVISISTGRVRADRAYLDKTFLAPEIPEGDYVYLEVSDTGGGMDADTQARIFEPFFSTKFTGRGLGLAAVLGIVRGHKGALKVYSEVGKGSSFKILLPITKESQEVVAQSDQGPLLSAHGTILVVDDEETVLAVAGQMLDRLGFQVVTAPDGRAALDTFREHGADVVAVLMDLTMPHLDGEETFHELRRLNPDVRVLLMSGYNEQDAIARFVGKGLAGFIQKPFGLDQLREAIRRLID